MKRDALFAALQALDRSKTAFVDLWTAHLVNPPLPFSDVKYQERRDNADVRWLEEITRFDEARSSVSLVCGAKMRSALFEVGRLIRTNASLVFQRKFEDSEFEAIGKATTEAIKKANALARAELGIVLPDEEAAAEATS